MWNNGACSIIINGLIFFLQQARVESISNELNSLNRKLHLIFLRLFLHFQSRCGYDGRTKGVRNNSTVRNAIRDERSWFLSFWTTGYFSCLSLFVYNNSGLCLPSLKSVWFILVILEKSWRQRNFENLIDCLGLKTRKHWEDVSIILILWFIDTCVKNNSFDVQEIKFKKQRSSK